MKLLTFYNTLLCLSKSQIEWTEQTLYSNDWLLIGRVYFIIIYTLYISQKMEINFSDGKGKSSNNKTLEPLFSVISHLGLIYIYIYVLKNINYINTHNQFS